MYFSESIDFCKFNASFVQYVGSSRRKKQKQCRVLTRGAFSFLKKEMIMIPIRNTKRRDKRGDTD